MSSQRTINGHNKPRKPGEKIVNQFTQTTAKKDADSRRSLEHAANTYANRSKETIAKQAKAHEAKEKSEARAKELEKDFADLFNGDLIDRMVASFNEFGIEATLKNFKNDLRAVELLSDEYKTLNTPISSLRTTSYFDEFLYRLARKYPKFILYLPAECFAYATEPALSLASLEKDELQLLEAKLEKTNLFSNSTFKKRYLKFFPKYITELNDVTDIVHALKIDPSCFQKFSPTGSFRSGFYQNPQPFATIVKNAPEVLKYATKEELCLFANKFGSQLGAAINKCPSVLENFPETFFKKFNPKLVFMGVTKTNLKPQIEPYFARFPELQTYFASTKIKAKPAREPKPIYQFMPPADPMDF